MDGDSVRTGWAPLAKLAPLVQPAAIAGLMLEQTPSLTRTTTEGVVGAVLVAGLLATLVAVAASAIVGRYVIGTHDKAPRWMPTVLIGIAALTGSVSVMVASGPNTSPVLSGVYLLSAVLLMWESHLTQQEIEEERDGAY